MSENKIKPEQTEPTFWGKALIVAQIAGGIAAVGAFGIGLVMLGMAI